METPPQKSILLVEDEAITAMLNTQTLQKCGYIVTTEASGEEAVEYISNNPHIDLILMDIDLGKGIDGTQTAEQILSKHDIPIVFLSSHTEPEIVEKTERITSYGYVVKNSSITVLDASIKMAFKLFDAKLNEKLKEQSLQQSNDKFKSLFNSMAEGFALHEIILNEQGNPVDYRFLDINPVFETLTGLRRAEILDKNILSVLPATENSWIEKYGKVAITGESIQFESYASNLNKYYQVIAFSPEKMRFATIFTDITEQKKNAAKLEEQNKEYESINKKLTRQNEELQLSQQSAKVGSWYLDIETNQVTWSDELYKIYGYDPKLPPPPYTEHQKLFTPQSWKLLSESMQQTTDNGIPYELELETIHRNGKKGWMWVYGKRVFDENGKTVGLLGAAQDTTERKLIEIELRSSVEELQRKNRELQITEETLRENEEKYRFLHEYAGIAVGYYTVDGIVISYNQLAARNMNGVPQDFAGKSIFDIFPQAEASFYLDRIKKSVQSAVSDSFVDLVKLPGKNVYFHSLFTKIKNSKNEIIGVQIMSQDITERIQKEEEIKTYAARIELTMKAANIAWWEMDIPTGNVVFAKQKTDMLGYEPEAFKHYSDFTKIVHPDDSEKAMAAMRNHFSGQADKYEVEYRILSRSGDYKWFYDIGSISTRDINGEPLKVAGIVIDITERKQEEIFANLNRDVLRILNEPENFDTSIQKTMSLIKNRGNYAAVAIRLQDGKDYPYYTQEGFTQDFLLSENGLLEYDKAGGMCPDTNGNSCLECTCGLVISGKADASNSLFTTGGSFWTNDSLQLLDLAIEDDPRNHPRNTCINQKYFSIALIPIRTDNKIVGLLQVNDFKKGRFTLKTVELFETIASYIGTALIRKQDDKKIQSLLSEKELILKEVHHRIKNNMNTIYGLLTLQANATVDQKTATTLKDAGNRVRSMMLLYDKLFKNRDVTSLSVQNYLPTLCEEIVSNFQNREVIKMEHNIEDFVLSANILQPLGIIINELMTNIMKYAFIGRSDGIITVTAAQQENMVVIIIADNGNGMPDSVSFEKSTGFGLVLVKGLTQQLGGTIRIERGQGTKIVLEFEK